MKDALNVVLKDQLVLDAQQDLKMLIISVCKHLVYLINSESHLKMRFHAKSVQMFLIIVQAVQRKMEL
jgi:hypothetical protein